MKISDGSARQVRSSAEANAALPMVTAAEASAVARLCRSPSFCVWYCSTAAVVVRIVARSMIAGMSSFSRRRAMASMLVIGLGRQHLRPPPRAAAARLAWRSR